MSIIVRMPPSPGYGVLGPRHPQFRDYWWVDWLSGVSGFYLDYYLKRIGTAFTEADENP